MILHLIHKSTGKSSALDACLVILEASGNPAALMLIEDAVYAAANIPANAAIQSRIMNLQLPCFVLKEDLQARGLLDNVAQFFKPVDYHGFVGLTLEYDKVQSWI